MTQRTKLTGKDERLLEHIDGLKELMRHLRNAEMRSRMNAGRPDTLEAVKSIKYQIQKLVVPYGFSLKEVLEISE